MLTVGEVAKRLSVGTRKVVEWIKSGELVAQDFGQGKYCVYRVSELELAAFLNRTKVSVRRKKKVLQIKEIV